MIKIENVSFKYKNENVIQNANLEIQEGEFISIIGKNGSRKIYFGKINFWISKTENRKNICG